MEIVYLWINNFRNLKNVSFNLGSEFFYDFTYIEKASRGYLFRNKNEAFVKNLYSPFLNISAIVGENASGKSSIIEALRQILNGSRDYFEYFIVFQKNNKVYYDYFVGHTIEIDVKSNFELNRGTNHKFQSIFFSQIIDLSLFPLNHDSELGIDISSNWLCFDDVKNKPNDSTQYDLAFHKYGETLRQLTFALNYNKANNILERINIPYEIDVFSTMLDYSGTHSGGFWNTPNGMRPYADLLLEKIKSEIHASTSTQQKNCFLWFLEDMICCLYKNFEISNHYLNAKTGLLYSQTDFERLSAIEAIKLFFQGQSLFDGQPAINLIETVEKLINSATNIESKFWTTKISDDACKLLFDYNDFLNSLYKFSSYGALYGFMSFDWRNMSTGEKAFFNLFARFFYAKELIIKKIKNQPRYSFPHEQTELPETIYILIDEGEIGFHLQWQKEYIQKLISILPQILSFDNHKVELQIIFTTHSPMSLSDIPNDHILYLSDGKCVDNEQMKSFGANISDLISQSFFIHNGLVGDFAKNKINETIAWLNEKENKDNAEYHKSLIQIIDEPIVRRKLIEMYADKMKDNTAKENLRNEIELLKEKYKSQYGEEV